MKKFIKEIIPYIVIVIVVVLIRYFIITPVRVDGDSMLPTLKDKEILLLEKYENKFNRFDIVVINTEKDDIIKRIIGLPGDYIEYRDNKLYVSGKEVKEKFKHNQTSDFSMEEITKSKKIPEGKYLVLGDNRPSSYDSRIMGLVDKKQIIGKVRIRMFPITKIGKIKK